LIPINPVVFLAYGNLNVISPVPASDDDWPEEYFDLPWNKWQAIFLL
jgi:hypothetical protein